jgi:hypothetical protein
MATGVAPDVAPTITFNAKVDAASIAGVELHEKATGTVVPATVEMLITTPDDPETPEDETVRSLTAVAITPDAELLLDTEYEIVVPATVLTSLDGKTAVAATFAFTTTDMVAP